MHHQLQSGESELDALNKVLADLGTIRRRSRFETLTEADFETMVARSRARLLALRAARLRDEERLEIVELTDAGEALAMAQEVGRSSGIALLLERHPELMTGRQLADLPEGVNRARTYADKGRPILISVDGGRS